MKKENVIKALNYLELTKDQGARVMKAHIIMLQADAALREVKEAYDRAQKNLNAVAAQVAADNKIDLKLFTLEINQLKFIAR